MQTPVVVHQLHVAANGVTRFGLTHDAIKSAWLPIPSPAEQEAIANFLEQADRRIRRYIRAKRQLIKLLEEEKRAIIDRAVTQGCDPDVRLRPSGVEWLGDIPEHWGVERSKWLFAQRKELARRDNVQLSATQAFGVIPQAEYERRIGRKVTKIIRHLDKRRHVEVDDFVISMRSFQGGLERAWAQGCIRSSYVVLHSSSPRIIADYFAFVFKSPRYIGALQATGNFIRDGQDLNFTNFCAVDLPLPPRPEQRQIADRLAQAVATNARAAEQAAQQIARLRELRTRLIADVVTGKLDVREAAARLPEPTSHPEERDEAGEPEELDAEETEEPSEDPDALFEEIEV